MFLDVCEKMRCSWTCAKRWDVLGRVRKDEMFLDMSKKMRCSYMEVSIMKIEPGLVLQNDGANRHKTQTSTRPQQILALFPRREVYPPPLFKPRYWQEKTNSKLIFWPGKSVWSLVLFGSCKIRPKSLAWNGGGSIRLAPFLDRSRKFPRRFALDGRKLPISQEVLFGSETKSFLNRVFGINKISGSSWDFVLRKPPLKLLRIFLSDEVDTL